MSVLNRADCRSEMLLLWQQRWQMFWLERWIVHFYAYGDAGYPRVFLWMSKRGQLRSKRHVCILNPHLYAVCITLDNLCIYFFLVILSSIVLYTIVWFLRGKTDIHRLNWRTLKVITHISSKYDFVNIFKHRAL